MQTYEKDDIDEPIITKLSFLSMSASLMGYDGNEALLDPISIDVPRCDR